MNDPAIESVAAEVYTVPTDAPEGDGTLTWDATTLVLARAVPRIVPRGRQVTAHDCNQA
jgi:hypothetical protein